MGGGPAVLTYRTPRLQQPVVASTGHQWGSEAEATRGEDARGGPAAVRRRLKFELGGEEEEGPSRPTQTLRYSGVDCGGGEDAQAFAGLHPSSAPPAGRGQAASPRFPGERGCLKAMADIKGACEGGRGEN